MIRSFTDRNNLKLQRKSYYLIVEATSIVRLYKTNGTKQNATSTQRRTTQKTQKKIDK